MLVLGRRLTEALRLTTPEGRVIRVVYCRHKQNGDIRLGIECDREVDVAREELLPLDKPFVCDSPLEDAA